MFEEEEFSLASRELDKPCIDDWDFFTESHDVKIYRQFHKESGLYAYKLWGQLKDVSPDICTKVYMDLDYRKTWDTYVKELEEIEDGEFKGIYWQVNFPFPMSNRDYVYVRELREVESEGRTVCVVLQCGDSCASRPPESGVIRVSDYKQCMVLTSDGAGGTLAFMKYFDNPGGMIPTWLVNWAAKTGVPKFLDQMQTACRGYPEYLHAKQQT